MGPEKEPIPGNKALSWILRVLLVVMAIVIGLFSLDVFGQGYSFWKTILAFTIHNIPSFVLLIVLAIAWKWEHIAGFMLVFLAMAGTLPFGPPNNRNAFAYTILGIVALIGIFFVLNYFVFDRKKQEEI
jgi:hypothetical protein